MKNHFILGLERSIDETYRKSTEELFDRVGHNSGNLAFHEALFRILGDPEETLIWWEDPETVNAMTGIGVIPCANQVGPHADFGGLAKRFAEIERPLVAVGLGAQGPLNLEGIPDVPEGTLNWLREIARRSPSGAPNIGVRGPYTKKVLAHYGLGDSAAVLGCPSLFINPDPQLGRQIESRITDRPRKIAIAAGHYRWKHLARVEQSLVRILEERAGAYVVQSPLEYFHLVRGEAAAIDEALLAEMAEYTHPGLAVAEYAEWHRKWAAAFFDVGQWIEYLRNCDFVVGTRIHGVMLALQAGTPALCIVHDSRTRELCEVMGVPFVMAGELISGFDFDQLWSKFAFSAAAFDENRRGLANNLEEFLVGNGLPNDKRISNGAGGNA